jgi:3-isopropylmalate/(R)-2-methylmalate dehydratase small subunit
VQDPGAHIVVDLAAQTVTGPDGRSDAFDIDPFRKECLLAGTDDITYTLRHRAEIAAFEQAYDATVPWMRNL